MMFSPRQPCFRGVPHLRRPPARGKCDDANLQRDHRGDRQHAARSSCERVSAATGCTILGKAEFINPGQSVKDRAALFIIQDAVKRGELRPGGVIVEGTAGNTGIGLALVGNALGYPHA